MGIIQRQAIQSTALAYLGTLFGFLNVSILMPQLLSTEEIGLLSVVNSLSKTYAVIFSFGGPLIAANLFNRYRNDNNNHNGFLTLLTALSILGIIVGITVYFTVGDYFLFESNSARLYEFFTLGWLVLFIFRLIFLNFDSYLRMNYKTVIGIFLENLMTKITFTFALLGLMVGLYEFDGVFFANMICFLIPGLAVIFYLIATKERFFKFKFYKRYTVRYRKFVGLSFFGTIGGAGSMFLMEVDRLMISNYMELSDVGIYSTMFFFGLFIAMPANSVKRVATAILAEAWVKKDYKEIDEVYKKSSLTLIIIGSYLFLGIWFSIDYLLEIMPSEYQAGKYVVLFIGLANLIDLAMGINDAVLVSSRYYKYNTYFVATLIFLVAGLNYIFIPIDGIIGAAYASAISLLFVNILRYLFLKLKFNFSPFTKEFVFALIVGASMFGVLSLIPDISHPLIGILINGSILTLLFWTTIYLLKLSPDINGLFDKYINKILKR